MGRSVQAFIKFSSKHYLIILVGLIFTGLRLYNLAAESLWYDEVGSIDQATRNLTSLFSGFLQDPPLYPLLLKYWIGLFGPSEFSVRIPSVIFSILSFILAYRLAELLWNKQAAIITALLFTLSPLHLFYSQETRFYMLSFFLVLLSAYIFLKLLGSGSKKYYFILTIVNIANLYANSITLVIILIENIILMSRFKKSKFNVRLWINSQLVTVLFFLLWLVFVLRNVNNDYDFFKARLAQKQVRLQQDIVSETFDAFAYGGYSYGGSDYYLVLQDKHGAERFSIIWLRCIYLLFLGYALTMFFKEKKEKLALGFIIFWLFVPVLVSSAFSKIYLPRYSLISLFPFYLLIAIGISKSDWFKSTVLATVICASFFPLQLYYGRVKKIDWKDATAYIERNISCDEGIVVSPAKHLQMFGYYFKYGIKKDRIEASKNDSLLRQTKQMATGPVFVEHQGIYFIGINDVGQLRQLNKKIKNSNFWLLISRWAPSNEESELLDYVKNFFVLREKKVYEGLSAYYFAGKQ